METRRLRLLLELSRLGSMREVADEMGITTSTVSQQIAILAREAGTALVEPAGRRIRLTPAGRRLAGHAVTILAAVEAARRDLDPDAEPVGTLRVAAFGTAIRQTLLPVVAHLAAHHPRVRLIIHEHEPVEALDLVAADEVDLALTYDYDLAPVTFDRTVEVLPLWSADWALAVPEGLAGGPAGEAASAFARFREHDWIVNSRNPADERVIRLVASTAGFEPAITHRVDSLELLQDLVVAGLGVGLLPAGFAARPGVGLVPLARPGLRLRTFAVTRAGRAAWPPLALVRRILAAPPPTPDGGHPA